MSQHSLPGFIYNCVRRDITVSGFAQQFRSNKMYFSCLFSSYPVVSRSPHTRKGSRCYSKAGFASGVFSTLRICLNGNDEIVK